jgi:hypothetical protein
MKSNLWTSSENEASLHKATMEIHIPMFQHSCKDEEHTEHWKGALKGLCYYWWSEQPEDITLGAHLLVIKL